jgi:two-component system nitrogen regulation sensor histidine kinase NtrY
VPVRGALITGAILLLAAALTFRQFERELSGTWLAFSVHPDVLGELEASLTDQKVLAKSDPANTPRYRRRFETLRTLLARLRVLAFNRGEIVERYELTLIALFGGVLGLAAALYTAERARQGVRLGRLDAALAELAAGRTEITVGGSGRGLLGRIGAMIEETSRVMAGDHRRLTSLENLAAWQEAARRMGHELRTPLTAARLELARLRGADGDGNADPADAREAAKSLEQELARLGQLVHRFTAFARLPQPTLETEELGALVGDFVRLFGDAWSNLSLVFVPPAEPVPAAVDREMLRQVLVNLCENSSLAVDPGWVTVRFRLKRAPAAVTLEVADDGPGIAAEVLPRLFAPYATNRPAGSGMGLGLALSRKILLDHGGDLELARTDAEGTVFRLILPRLEGGE